MPDPPRWTAEDLELGEEILRIIEDDTWHERHGWAPERVERVRRGWRSTGSLTSG